MAVQNPTIEIFSGDTKRLNYTVRDANGAAIDITGGTFRWGLSKLSQEALGEGKVKPQGDALVTKTLGLGITLTAPTLGQLRVTLDPADTASLKGDFYHELEMVLAGATSTVAFGRIDIKKDLLE
ncbi:MAG: hypothetical protein V3T08_09705 [Gemmatimonadota bacterium]